AGAAGAREVTASRAAAAGALEVAVSRAGAAGGREVTASRAGAAGGREVTVSRASAAGDRDVAGSRASAGVARDVGGSAPVARSGPARGFGLRRGLSPAPERWLRCRIRAGCTAREVRSFPRSEARRRLAALAVHVASAKVLLGRQQIVGRTAKLQVVHAVRAAPRMCFAVVQLQAARLRAASS